jgi:hypothetical protein
MNNYFNSINNLLYNQNEIPENVIKITLASELPETIVGIPTTLKKNRIKILFNKIKSLFNKIVKIIKGVK